MDCANTARCYIERYGPLAHSQASQEGNSQSMTTLLFLAGVVASYLLVVTCLALWLHRTSGAPPEAAMWRASGLPIAIPAVQRLGRRSAAYVVSYLARRRQEARAREEAAEAYRLERERSGYTFAMSTLLVEESLPPGYEIRGADSVRDNAIDPWIKRRYRAIILEAFGNECAHCGNRQNLDLDHLWWPKSRGGNFAMRYASGPVANVTVLCRSCNSSKGEAPAVAFFGEQALSVLAEALVSITGEFKADTDLIKRLS